MATIASKYSLDMDKAPRSVFLRYRVPTSASTSACTPRLTARRHNRTCSEIDRLDNEPKDVDGVTLEEGLDEHGHEHQSGDEITLLHGALVVPSILAAVTATASAPPGPTRAG